MASCYFPKKINNFIRVTYINHPYHTILFVNDDKSQKKADMFHMRNKNAILKEYDNTLIPGFKFNLSTRYYTVEDPRGFRVYISQNNVQDLMKYCTTRKGLILEKCIWAIKNPYSNNQEKFLVPESHPLFEEYARTTELFSKTVDVKNVDIGDTILLKNGIVGTYLGKHRIIQDRPSYEMFKGFEYIHFVEYNDGDKTIYLNCKTLYINSILDKAKTPMSHNEAYELITKLMHRAAIFDSEFEKNTQTSIFSTIRSPLFITDEKGKQTIETFEISHSMASALFFTYPHFARSVITMKTDDSVYIFHSYNMYDIVKKKSNRFSIGDLHYYKDSKFFIKCPVINNKAFKYIEE